MITIKGFVAVIFELKVLHLLFYQEMADNQNIFLVLMLAFL